MGRKCVWVKGILAAAVLAGLCGCAGGCGKETKVSGEVQDTGVSLEQEKETKVVEEPQEADTLPEKEKEDVSSSDVPGEEGIIGQGFYSTGEDGVVFLTDKMMFYDYQSGAVYPLCNRPNCRHDSDSECAAVLGKGTYSPFLYEGMLYYFDSVEEGWALYRADVSGENRKELTLFEGFSGVGGAIAVTEGKLYFGTSEFFTENYDDERPSRCTASLIEVDLETGDMRTLLTCEGAGDSRLVWTPCHVYGGDVYLMVESRGATDGDILEGGLYAIHPESGQVEPVVQSEELRVAGWWGRNAVCYQYASGENAVLQVLDLKTGETEALAVAEQNPLLVSALLDGTFVWREEAHAGEQMQWKACGLSDQTVKTLHEIASGKPGLTPITMYIQDGRRMIFGNGLLKNEAGELVGAYGTISEEEFLAGSSDFRFLCEETY